MTKIMTSFGLYWHFILDIVLTHIYVIAFLHAGLTTAAALLMSLDSILKVTLSIFITHIVMHYRSSVRYKASTAIRLILIGIWFAAISQLPFNNFSILILIPYIVFKLLILIDSSLSADLIFAAHEKYHIDLSKSAAAQNILVRASTAFAPAIALTILSMTNTRMVPLLSAIIIGLFSITLLRGVLFDPKDLTSPQRKEDALTFSKLIKNPLMRWGLTFQIIGNIAFAGVAFLLLTQLKIHGNVFLNEITALYTAFLIAQGIVLIFGESAVPLNKTSHVGFIMGVCGFFVILASATNFGILKLFLCAGIGLTYSFMLSGVQKVVTSKLRGPGFLHYAGWSQTVSRLTSFIITGLFGLVMSFGVSPNLLLMMSGSLGIICAITLGFLPTVSTSEQKLEFR